MDNKGDEVIKEGSVLKSKFMTDAKNVIPILNQTSKTLCLAKWKQVSLHLTNGMNNSCYHPPLHKIDENEIKINPSALHNTKHKKEQRKLMLEGKRPDECSYCWAIEDSKNLSDRAYRSAEPWAIESLSDIINSSWDKDINPSYVEVNFNTVCNLKCSYCSPQFSSSWAQEAKQFGPWPTNPRHNDLAYFGGDRQVYLHSEPNPYVDAFWKWWPDLYKGLRHFRMTGGEPMLDNNTYRVFHYVISNPKPDLHLSVTSNFSQPANVFGRYLDYVKNLCDGNKLEHFMQYVSIDTWGKQAEYIRHGLNFDLLWENVHRYLDEVPYKNSLTFIITLNNLSVPGLDKLLTEILNLRIKYSHTYQRVWFDTPYLRKPEWQSLSTLPVEHVYKLDSIVNSMQKQLETDATRFHGFKDYEVQRLQRVIDNVRLSNRKGYESNAANFYRFFNEHDKRRGTNFLETFPEMNQFWKMCEYYAKAEQRN